MSGRHTSSKIKKLGILSQNSLNAPYLHYTKEILENTKENFESQCFYILGR